MEIKLRKRILSGLLIITLSVTMLFANYSVANAMSESNTMAEEFYYSIVRPSGFPDGYQCVRITGYKGKEENVVIPEMIYGIAVEEVGTNAFHGKNIKKISGPSIKRISGRAILNCEALINVDFPKLTYIGSESLTGGQWGGAFENCTSLTTLTFPMVTSVGYYAFNGCQSLEVLNLPSLKGIGNGWGSEAFATRGKNGPEKLVAIKSINVPCTSIPGESSVVYSRSAMKPIHNVTNWNIDEQSTCVKEGKRNGVCESCSESVTEIIPIDSTVHNYGNWITTKNPTCSTVGEKERVCVDCKNKDIVEIPIDSTAHSFTNYVYNNDAKVGVDGTETAVCDNGCGTTDTRTKPGTALEGGGSSGGGGSWIPSMQYPNISEGDGYTTSLSDGGSRVTITIDEDYELVDVFLNGVSKGNVTELSGLRTGDEVVITVISKVDKIQQTLAGVSKKNLLARSSQVKMKNGRKAIKITVINKTGIEFDGIEVFRSMKKDSGYGKKPIFTTKTYKYYNTAVKKGKRYYYRVRGYIEYEGVKYYSDWSARAWRTVK